MSDEASALASALKEAIGCLARQIAPSAPVLPPMLLTDLQLAELLGVGVRTADDIQNEPWAPKAIILGPRLKRHSRLEWEEAVARMPRREEAREPLQLLKARSARAGNTVVKGSAR